MNKGNGCYRCAEDEKLHNRETMTLPINGKYGEKVQNVVVSPTSEGDQIHLNLAAVKLMPTIHFDREVHLPCSSQSSCILSQPASSMSSILL